MSVSSEFSFSVARATVKTAELFTVTLRTGAVYRYTSHQKDIVWNGETFTAIPISRDASSSNLSLEIDELKVYVAAVSGDIVDVIEENGLDAADLLIEEIVRGSTYGANQARTIFKGWVNVEFTRNLLTLTAKAWIDSLNIQVPRNVVQAGCNWSLFDSWCQLSQASFSYVGAAVSGSETAIVDSVRGMVYKAQFTGGSLTNTIKKGEVIAGGTGGGVARVVNIMYETDGSGRLWYCRLTGTQYVNTEVLTVSGGGSVTVSGSPAEDNTLYRMGEVRILTGANAGQRRPVLWDVSYEIRVVWPFGEAIGPSVSYALYPACDGRAQETCHSWYGNVENFSGYLFGPRFAEVI